MGIPNDTSASSSTGDGISHASLSFAVVGAGLMGRFHAESGVRAGGKLVAVIDMNDDAAHQLSVSYPGSLAFSSLRAALGKSAVDVVHICTPLATHSDLINASIDAGCHVLVEKPINQTSADTRIALKAARSNNRYLCPVHQFLFQEGVKKALSLLPDIGRLIHMDTTIHSAGGVGLTPDQKNEVVADILPHPLSLIDLFLPRNGGPAAWSAQQTAPGELRANGTSGQCTLAVTISLSGRPTRCDMTLVGSQKSIFINLFHGYCIVNESPVTRRGKIVQPFRQSFAELVSASTNILRRAVRRETAYPGLRSLVSLFYASIRSGGAPPLSDRHILDTAVQRDMLIKLASLGASA